MYETFQLSYNNQKTPDGNCSYQLLSWRFLLGAEMNYTKVCTSCQEEFPATSEYFGKHKGGKYGLLAKCKVCHKNYQKELYLKHRNKRLNDVKKYQIKNKNKIRKRLAKSTLNRYHNDTHFKIKMNLSRRLRQFIKKEGKRTVDFIGCSIDYIKIHLEKQFTTGMTWDNYGKWHIDHIMPCASFDLTDPEQQKKCFHYSNLQPLWAVDNLRKSDKVLYNQQ